MAQLTSQSINSESATAKAVLDRFFSNSNVFGNPNSGLVSETKIAVPKELLFSISRYSKGIFDRPLLLPFKSSDDERTCWMACAHDVLNSRGLRDEMVAFVGPSFGEFQIDGAILSDLQEMAKSILIQAGLHVTCFFAISAKFEPRVTSSWQRYWQLLDQRPERPRQELRTFHQLRAAFDRALVARNEKDAVSAMVALRDQHGLSAENRAFLEIRLHASLGRWDRILAHPQWDDLLKVRLPPETYGDIWDALYETYLGPLELRGVATELIAAFVQDVRIVASSLLKGRAQSPTCCLEGVFASRAFDSKSFCSIVRVTAQRPGRACIWTGIWSHCFNGSRITAKVWTGTSHPRDGVRTVRARPGTITSTERLIRGSSSNTALCQRDW